MSRLPRALARRAKPARPEEWFLGPLEARVLAALMDGGPGSVADVAMRLRPTLAYTTVMSELVTLHRKGLAERQKQGRAYRYEAVMSADDLRRAMVGELTARLLEDFGDHAVAEMAATFGPRPRRRRRAEAN